MANSSSTDDDERGTGIQKTALPLGIFICVLAIVILASHLMSVPLLPSTGPSFKELLLTDTNTHQRQILCIAPPTRLSFTRRRGTAARGSRRTHSIHPNFASTIDQVGHEAHEAFSAGAERHCVNHGLRLSLIVQTEHSDGRTEDTKRLSKDVVDAGVKLTNSPVPVPARTLPALFRCTMRSRPSLDHRSLNCLECSICLDGFENSQSVGQTPCKHVFHQSCLERWLTRFKGSCPLCQTSLKRKRSATAKITDDQDTNV
jgi:hypothetical protein